MTLDEAIKHAEEVAEENEDVANTGIFMDGYTVAEMYGDDTECINAHLSMCAKCAEEHRQLAEWLKELKDYRERIPSYEAGYNDAKREIALSGEYERCYERGKADAQPKTGHWINKSHTSGCGVTFVESECTCCKKKTPFNCDEFLYRYCPNCGAKMIKPQESEE